MIRFANWYFLLLIPPVIAIFILLAKQRKSALGFSSISLLVRQRAKRPEMHWIGRCLVVLGLTAAIIALARPQKHDAVGTVEQGGIDIAVVLDVSLSMQSVDFTPNRLETAKKTINKFVSQRPQDRMALVVFKATAHTVIPLTLDHDVIREALLNANDDSVEEDGTAIGLALAVALNRLKDSEAESRVIILVTDGDNNAGAINPYTAADMAKEMGIKIYAIGVGSDVTIIPYEGLDGTIEYERYEMGINEELLEKIAETTGGNYYRAKDPKALSSIFSEIDRLEKTEFDQGVVHYYTEYAWIFIKIALLLLIAGIYLDRYVFIRIP